MRKLRVWEWLVLASAVVLELSLFVEWYSVAGGAGDSRGGLTGWEAFTVVDLIVTGVVLAAVGAVVIAATRSTGAAITTTSLVGLAAVVVTVVVLIRLLNLPDAAEGGSRSVGAWLAMAGALGLLGACLGAIRDQRSPGVPAQEIPTLSAPAGKPS